MKRFVPYVIIKGRTVSSIPGTVIRNASIRVSGGWLSRRANRKSNGFGRFRFTVPLEGYNRIRLHFTKTYTPAVYYPTDVIIHPQFHSKMFDLGDIVLIHV